MLALAFSFSLFAYWTLTGRALLSVIYPRFGVLRSWLLAPGMGLSFTLLGLMLFNQAGLPIARFAVPFTVLSSLAAVAILAWRRPLTPVRPLAPFLAAIVVALLWVGWPALQLGFDWISYANDDMANYCLAAQRFIDHGFYDVPSLTELGGRDYASHYFFMHVADMMRFGAEHLVAWATCLAKVQATQAFMPTIIALALVQIAVAASLAFHRGRNRRVAMLTAWILGACPLFMLGTLYQVIAQVGGIAVLMTLVALVLRPRHSVNRRSIIRYAILPSLAGAALCICYPEVTPFAVLAFCAHLGISFLQTRSIAWPLVVLASYTLLGVVLLLRHNLISYLTTLMLQFNGAMSASNLLLSLFPYFMIPTGFSNLFGWMPIARDFSEPFLSLSIAAGILLAVIVVVTVVRQAWRLSPPALLLLVELSVCVKLYTGNNDFGLYKMAMWMQPVIAATLATLILTATRQRMAWAVGLVALYVVSTIPTALHYTDSSRGLFAGGLTELRFASQLGLKPTFPADKDGQLTATTENVVAAKFAGSQLRGYPLAILSRDFFVPVVRTDLKQPPWAVKLHPHFDEMYESVRLTEERNQQVVRVGKLWNTHFSQPVLERPTAQYVSLDRQLSLFNKFGNATITADESIFVFEPAEAVRNRVIFVHSGLGHHYYLGERRRIAFFQQERDLYNPGKDMNAIGRFLLLRVEKSSPEIYLRVSATRTMLTGRTAWNPRAVVHGETDLPLGAVGNGAFNLFIGPLQPKQFESASYVAIDFAETPQHLRDYRSGLKRLYGEDVALDYRRFLGWARDISAISVEDYAALERPRIISTFPKDLASAQTLEFSGAYDDGWLSPHARFVLGAAQAGELLRLRALVPHIEGSALGTGTVDIRINGEPVAQLPAPLGMIDWLLPIPQPGAKTTVELRFDAAATLPGRDLRPVSAQLEHLGVLEAPDSLEYDFDSPATARIASAGIDADGWMTPESRLILPTSEQPMKLRLQFEVPGWAGTQTRPLHVTLNGRDQPGLQLVPGQIVALDVDLPATTETRVLNLATTGDFSLPSPDTRHRSLRLVDLRLSPAGQ